MMKKATPEESQAVTFVLWDIDKFPVPRFFDPRLVSPCIERFLDQSHGYSGALTISAFGVLTDVPEEILRGVYCSGIDVTYVAPGRMDMLDNLYAVTLLNEPPHNIIAISEPDEGLCSFFESYNVLQPFLSAEEFNSFLADYFCFNRVFLEQYECPAYWDCFACNSNPPSQGKEHQERLLILEFRALNSTCVVFPLIIPSPTVAPPLDPPTVAPSPSVAAPLDPPTVAAPMHPRDQCYGKFLTSVSIDRPLLISPEIDKEAVISVFWDIIGCPVPSGFDPRLAGTNIRWHLKNEGYSGPLTITAVGLLTEVPDDVLRGVYSSGIRLTYVLDYSEEIWNLMYEFTKSNPPPANIMVIGDHYGSPGLYNILHRSSFEECLAGELEEEEDKCSKRGEWVCTVCRLGHASSQGFEKLTTHLASRAHERKMWAEVPRIVRISKKQPLNTSYHRQVLISDNVGIYSF